MEEFSKLVGFILCVIGLTLSVNRLLQWMWEDIQEYLRRINERIN